MTRLGPVVAAEADRCLKRLEKEHGTRATRAELLGALLEHVPLWQIDHMVRVYIAHTDEDDHAEGTGSEQATT
jgi:hypothetical protein